MVIDRPWVKGKGGGYSPLSKQVPTTLLFVALLVINLVDPALVVDDSRLVLAGAALVFLATILATIISFRVGSWRLDQVVPTIDVIAIAVLLVHTPIGSSSYWLLTVLPIIWLAGEAGLRYTFYCILAILLVAAAPLIVGINPFPEGPRLVGAIFAIVVLTTATIAINELARLARLRTEAMEQAAKLKDEFISMVSHELRTPLTSMLGFIELIQDDDSGSLSEDQVGYLDITERNSARLLHLVEDLLFTMQVESGSFTITPVAVDVSSVIRASLESAAPAAAKAQVELNDKIKSGLYVSGDRFRLGQAFDNLISNAIKFTPPGGSVTARSTSTADTVTIDVADTGLGIAADELHLLTQRFYRARTATTNVIPGVGLGLAITKAIIEAHHGHVRISSVEGRGSSFSVELPRTSMSAASGNEVVAGPAKTLKGQPANRLPLESSG